MQVTDDREAVALLATAKMSSFIRSDRNTMASYRTWTVGPVSLTQVPHESGQGQSCCGAEQKAVESHLIPVRLWESDENWTVEADVPGVLPEQINMEFFQNRLTISYDRLADGSRKSTYDNRQYGKFQRVIRMAEDVQSDAIVALAESGVLRITLPKSGLNVPKRIVVSGQ
jgi:HSP20 family molecular chaperone IbpA